MTPTLAPDTRQIARTYEYGPMLARHINWQSIGDEARTLGASFEAIFKPHGGITVTIYWPTDTP